MEGFTEESSYLYEMLLPVSGDQRRSIVMIVGESGIGKSTLARVVLDNHVVKKHFQAHAWLNLPPSTTEADALYLIYQLLCPFVEAPPKTDEEIRSALTEFLMDRSYVIVLDGIEKLFNWSSVIGALPDNNLGSRVVIIDALNNNEVALAGVSVLRVDHLKQKESHALFLRHALRSGNKHLSKSFGNKDLLESADKEQILDNIFEITTGFPLAILLLGRLLRRKEFPNQWRDVLKNLKSKERSSLVERILALSFDDLPHPLKLCFLYFSMMPKNMNYAAAVLVRRWAAEGFLIPTKGESMEDVGHNYLKELISRGMVHINRKGALTPEGSTIRSVFIHRRLHAMARLETQNSSFLEICDTTDVPSSTFVRHLFIQKYRDGVGIPMDSPFPKLRSVRCHFSEYRESIGYHFSEYWEPVRCQFPEYWKSDLGCDGATNGNRPYHIHSLRHLLRSKLLRVIELRGLQVKKLPRAIGSLVHLRYLGIRNSSLVELPSTIGNLTNLQTLDIQKNRVKKIPRSFWMILTLRHVLAETLLLPKSVGVLKNMQTLRGIVCAHPWQNNATPLHSMINLRRLEISEVKSHHWSALLDAFKKLESLVRLHINADKDDAVPFALFTNFTLRHVHVLELHGRIEMLGEEREEPFTLPNLSWLLLKFSRVHQDFFYKIGKLPRLTELVLSDEAFLGSELIFSNQEGGGFNNLTDLAFCNLAKSSELRIIGLQFLAKVKKIEVTGCTELNLEYQGEQVLNNLGEFENEDNTHGSRRWRRYQRNEEVTPMDGWSQTL